MNTSVRIRARGEMALFTDPASGVVERCSYPFVTPSAARGLVKAVFARPLQMDWVVSRISVLQLGHSLTVTANEVKFPSKPKNPLYASEHRNQVCQRVLTDVDYVIEVQPEVFVRQNTKDGSVNTDEKYISQLTRRLRSGRYYEKPYFGTRDYPADVELWEGEMPETSVPDIDVNGMLLGISFGADRQDGQGNIPVFFNAELRRGICEVPKFVGRFYQPGEAG